MPNPRIIGFLLTTAIVASCGDSSAASAPTRAPAIGVIPWSPRTASPTPTSAPTAAPRQCAQDEIGSTFGGWGAAVGSVGGTFQLLPTSSGAGCVLAANPAVRIVGRDGTTLVSEPSPSRQVTWVPLVSPNGKASTFVSVVWTNHGGEPAYACARRTSPAAALQLEMPSGRIALMFPAGSQPTFCADPPEHVFVSVMAPDQQPPPPPPVFSVAFQAPPTAHAGERFRYVVELTNITTVPLRFADCPAYIHNIAGPHELGSGDRPGFITPERRQILSCGGIGDVPPGAALAFEMLYEVPPDALAGSYVLAFRLDGPMYGGSKTQLTIVR